MTPTAKRKAELRQNILSDIPWVLGQMEERGESIRSIAVMLATRLSRKMTQAELETWAESVQKTVDSETDRLREKYEGTKP